MKQLPLLGNVESVIPIALDPNHSMVRLTRLIDWSLLIEIAVDCRAKVVKSSRGMQPNYRANCGAVVVRSLRSADLRTTEDLVRNYLPARYMCDLHNSHWTPDHDTIWEFEVMLGEEGLSRINRHILSLAQEEGFLDTKGLCSDTTAQEAKIPHPNEVGMMGAFGKSISRGLQSLGNVASGMKKKIKTKIKEIAKNLRKYRLFSKTKEAKQKVAAEMSKISKEIMMDVGHLLGNLSTKITGGKRRAANHMAEVHSTMQVLIGQMDHWIKTGKVAAEKIVALFQKDLRSIPRGKIGKEVEFGVKWGINQIRGGYVHLFLMSKMRAADCEYAVESIREHIRLFGTAPREFGFDRGGWSPPHMEKMRELGVKRIGVAPKGKAEWKVSESCCDRIKCERAQVEGKIGTLKHYGLNKPEEKTTTGMHRAARRAELRFNCGKFLRDLFPPVMKSAVARV